ncbi:MAG: transferase [Sphingobacteriales bacterium]|nr:MAG: transferase [Sphingobacteriales bacterium]
MVQSNRYLLLGNGGHARVIKDLIEKRNGSVVHVFNSDVEYDAYFEPGLPLIVAIGNNTVRSKIVAKIRHSMPVLIHPSAQLAADVVLGAGTIVLANAVIQAGAKMGRHCLVNANVVIDHEAQMGDFVNIYPNVYIGGAATISNYATIEPGTIISRGQKV